MNFCAEWSGPRQVTDGARTLTGARVCSNNLLYPYENRRERQLQYRCKHCQHLETASTSCVYSNHIATKNARLGNRAGIADRQVTSDPRSLFLYSVTVNRDVVQDPTLPRLTDVSCPFCAYTEAVYMTAGTGRDDAMKLILVCCNRDCGRAYTQY